ncbi:MAG: tandem-95 repeat protein [Proteobacteria bacterium]|nr:tandem-95 repeat protein [Pseudomonadota bacterium]
MGDALAAGDVVLAAADARIEVSDAAGQAWLPVDVAAADTPARAAQAAAQGNRAAVKGAAPGDAEGQSLDDVLGAVERGDADAATAAGLTGAGGASLGEGLRVDRVIEVVTPQAFSDSAARAGVSGLVATTAPQASAGDATVPATDTQPQAPANTAPQVGNYANITKEDEAVSGRVTGTDADGDSLTYSKASDPQHGTVVVNPDGTYTYTPAKDYHGADSFTVQVSDGQDGTALSTVDIEVTPVNDPPKFDDPKDGNYDPVTGHYSATTDEDTPVSGKVTASDADGDALTYAKDVTQGAGPKHGTVTVDAQGNWTYTPDKDYHGPDSFKITVSDGKSTATATVDIGVNPVNDPPKFDDPSSGNPNIDPSTGHYKATTDEDQPVSGKVTASDLDGDALTFAKGANPAHGTVTVDANGNWTYTPAKDYNGPDSFTITVSDGKGGTATATVDIGVNPVNDPPKFEDPSSGNPNIDPSTGHYKATTDEDQPVSGKVTASDVDGDALTFAKGANPAHGTVTVDANGNWTYTPAKDYNGADSFTITVSDGKGGTATATVDIGVAPINDAPVITQATATVSEEGLAGANADNTGSTSNNDSTNAREASGHITVTDVDNSSLTLTLSGPSGLTSGSKPISWTGDGSAGNPLVGSADGKPILTATIDASGNYKVTLSGPIDHAGAGEDVRSISLTVKASDGQAVGTGTLTLNVEDDAPLSGSQTVQVNAVSAAQNTNLMLIIDTSGSMDARLSDQSASSIKAALKNLIDQYDGLGDVKVQIVTFSDKGAGQKLWMSVSDAKTLIDQLTADGGTNYDAALAAAQKAFACDGKIAGGVNVSYFVTDGQPNEGKGLDAADEAKWEGFLTANAIDSYAIGTGSLTSQNVANIEPIAYNGITGKEQAAVTLATNAELGKYLLDTVPVVKSGSLATLAGADGLQKIESFSASGQLGSSLDSKTQILTIQLKSGGEMKVNMLTGEFTLTQPKNAAAETFSYSMLDKDGDRGTGTVSLSVTNHAPTGTAASVTLAEDSSHTFKSADFGFKDQDAGDSLRAVRIDGLPAHGTLSLDGVAVVQGQLISSSDLGKLVFKPEANANGSNYAQLSFSVQDSYGAFDTSSRALQINVTPVNDAPEVYMHQSGHDLLGLVGISVDPILNLTRTQAVTVNDIDHNLAKVEVRVSELFSLGSILGGHDKLTVSTDVSLTQGLHISGNGSGYLVIESATPGGTVDITQVNKLLATLHYDPADLLGLSADLLPYMTVKATDTDGASASQTIHSSLINVGWDLQPVLAAGETLLSGHGEHTAASGTEVFQWTLADRPASGSTCVDTILGFDGAARTAGGDVLDLRDLLSGEHASVANGQVDVGNLLNHLDFDTQSQPGSTVIHVSATGSFSADTSGNSHSDGCANQQQIVLAGVDIRSSLGLDAQANDHQIIAELMQRGKLLVDHS